MNRVLITGGLGILGSNLTKKLSSKKFEIFIIDKKEYKKKYKILKFSKKIKIFKINFGNYKKIFNFIKKNNINIIYHLGASTQVIDSYKNPMTTFQDNIIGTINILEAVRKINKNIKIIFSSSDKAYGNLKEGKYKENNRLEGKYTYDVSKSSADLIAQAYNETYGLKIGIIRSGNIYGPGDFNLNRIVPNLIIDTLNNRRLAIRSNGKLRRDYIYVDDVVRAYFKITHKLNNKNNMLIYNIGSKENFNALEIVKKLHSLLNIKDLKPIILDKTTNIEIKNQTLDYSKIKKDLKWKPSINFNKGIKKTFNWYKKNLSKFK